VDTSYAIEKIAAGKGIYTPIVNEVAAMLRGKDVQESLRDLLSKK
jgi:glycerol-3-phosphate dehydrogenase [NAD(P)+]